MVTGLIKANFPCRVSFQVANKYDSRTILDTAGAEQLLGKGDMLFKPTGGKLQRLHGPFVTDDEVQAVADHWRRQCAPQYEVDFTEWGTSLAENAKASSAPASGPGSSDEESLYAEAVAFVQEQDACPFPCSSGVSASASTKPRASSNVWRRKASCRPLPAPTKPEPCGWIDF